MTEGLEIKKYPSEVLRKSSKSLGMVTGEDRKLLEGMVKTMYDNQGVGLAAPQIGISKRAAVVDVGGGPIKFINPEIIKKEGSDIVEEGCLSIPGASVKVKRAKKIKVRYMDENGKTLTIVAEGLLARAIQHEIDHLNGRLIIDYLNPIKRFFTKRNLSK